MDKSGKQKNIRNYAFDNMKFILIFCVVFGHILEISPVLHGEKIHRLIYSFHMPLFIFISGYFAKFNKRRIVFYYGALYIIFQVLYIAFEKNVINSAVTFQFMQPHWILWYLFIMIMYSLLIPFLDTSSTKNQVLIVFFSILLSIYKGHEKTVLYTLSVSRFFVFMPFFIMGYYMRKQETNIEKFILKMNKKKKIIFAAFGTLLIFCASFYILFKEMPPEMLYGAYNYTCLYDVYLRIMIFAVSVIFIFFFFFVLKKPLNRKIPIISAIGKNTLPVFLLHGFLIKLFRHGLIKPPQTYFEIIVLVLAMLVLFGNNLIAKLFKMKKI